MAKKEKKVKKQKYLKVEEDLINSKIHDKDYIEKELKKKYFEVTQSSTNPEVHDHAFKEFLAKLYQLKGYQGVFQHLQLDPFQNGVETLFAYLLGEITPKEAYQLTSEQCVKLYVNNLLEFELVSEEDICDLDSLYEEVVFEAIKGVDTLGKAIKRLYCGLKMTIKEKLQLRQQDRVAYIVWFNILEKLHNRLSLPSVSEFTKCFFVGSIEPIGRQVILGNDFSEFHLEPGDLEKYRQLCL